MRIEVISEPMGATAESSQIREEHLLSAVRYDEEMLKPALLLADEVLLRSWRLDVREATSVRAARYRLPIPLVSTIVGVLARANPNEYESLGVDPEQVRSLRATASRLGLEGPEDFSDYSQIEEMFTDPVVRDLAKTQIDKLRAQYEALSSPSLERLSQQGQLLLAPWDDRDWQNWPESMLRRIIDPQGPLGSETYGGVRLVDTLGSSESQVLLDPYLLRSVKSSRSGITAESMVLRNASELLRLVDELSSAPLDEVIDLRSDLSPHLTSFRAFILKHASNFDLDAETPVHELRRAASLYWEANVAPELDDFVRGEQSQSLSRNVVRTITEGPDAAIGVCLGLFAAAGANTLGISTVAGAAVGALPILVKAISATIEARGARLGSGAYFLVEAKRRLGRLT